MRKYIYFGQKTARSEALTTSVSGADQTFVIADGGVSATVANITTDAELFKSNAIVVDLIVDANHANGFGTHYGTPTAADVVRIHGNALSYDGTNTITVLSKVEDPVYGITMSDTEGDNHITVTQKKPITTEDASVFCSDLFLGINQASNTTAIISFKPQSNDGVGNGVDIVTCTYDTGKFKEFAQMVSDCIMDNRNQGGMVVFADEWEGVYYNGNPAGVSTVDINMD
tara:strand:- start:92 stop:775 length:684 start_codon:yes stop_codon:yes gene_type:complete